MDYRQKINDVNFVLSGTDASARDYESVPAVKDIVITADTHVNGEKRNAASVQQALCVSLQCLLRCRACSSPVHDCARRLDIDLQHDPRL